MKLFDTFMNCYRDDSRQYVSSITQFSVLFPLELYIFFTIFDLVNWNLWIILDLNIQNRFEVDFQVRIVKGACTFWCVKYSPEHARMKLTHFIYLQLTIHWQIKHFTVIYGAANNNFDTKIEYFLPRKNLLIWDPISLSINPNLPIWVQENITCMTQGSVNLKKISTLRQKVGVQTQLLMKNCMIWNNLLS